jgi:hypothetical protein
MSIKHRHKQVENEKEKFDFFCIISNSYRYRFTTASLSVYLLLSSFPHFECHQILLLRLIIFYLLNLFRSKTLDGGLLFLSECIICDGIPLNGIIIVLIVALSCSMESTTASVVLTGKKSLRSFRLFLKGYFRSQKIVTYLPTPVV